MRKRKAVNRFSKSKGHEVSMFQHRPFRHRWLLAFILCFAGELFAGGVENAQDATVFIKVFQNKKYFASGSGFVIHTDADGMFIVTNHHVVRNEEEKSRKGRRIISRDGDKIISLIGVLRSGTKGEKSVPLEVRALDAQHDLALLHAPPIPKPPKPILLSQATTVQKKQEVGIIGFPWGEILDIEGKNPVLTLSRAEVVEPSFPIEKKPGLVSGEHPDNRDFMLSRGIGVVGGGDHGNSGGPVVDSQGRLVGVLSSGAVEVHFIQLIPPNYVKDLWNGIYLLGKGKLYSGMGRTVHLDIPAHGADSFGNVVEAKLVILPSSLLKDKKNPSFQQFHRDAAAYFSQEIPSLSSQPDTTVPLRVKVDMPENEIACHCAFRLRRKDKSEWFGEPQRIQFGKRRNINTNMTQFGRLHAIKPLTVDFSETEAFLNPTGEGSTGDDQEARRRKLHDLAFSQGQLGGTKLIPCATTNGMRITHVDTEGKIPFQGSPIWDDDGRTAYVLSRLGWVIKINLPSFERVDVCQIAHSASDTEDKANKRPASTPKVLVRSQKFLIVLSGKEDYQAPAWIQVIDGDTFRTIGVFAASGIVDLSAVPESDRILVRYFTGELGFFDPNSGKIRLICRTKFEPGFRVAASIAPVSLPVENLSAAVLVSPGNRILAREKKKVFALQLRDDGTLIPPGSNTPVWKGCTEIRYEPGSSLAMLLDYDVAISKKSKTPIRLVDLKALRTVKLKTTSRTACLDIQSATIITAPNALDLQRWSLRGQKKQYRWEWPAKGGRFPNSFWPQTFFAHPRGNSFWMLGKGKLFWVEFTQTPWVLPNAKRPLITAKKTSSKTSTRKRK